MDVCTAPRSARRSYTFHDHDPSKLPRTAAISYLSPLLAVVVGIFHASLAPVIVIGGVKPNLVLVAVVLVTALVGFLPGVTWAFVAGLTVNLLVGDPLGSIPLTMLLVAVLVAAGARVVGRASLLFPVIAGLAGSVVADVGLLLVRRLVGDAPGAGLPMDLILAAAVLNAALTALLVLPVRAGLARYVGDEVPAW